MPGHFRIANRSVHLFEHCINGFSHLKLALSEYITQAHEPLPYDGIFGNPALTFLWSLLYCFPNVMRTASCM